MFRYLYEALNAAGDPCILFDAANDAEVHQALRAYSTEDKTDYTARFYRRIEADTREELDELTRATEDKWARDTSPQAVDSVASTGHPTVAPTGRNTGVSVASAGRKGPDSDSRTSHYADIEPERSPRVAPAQERATGATVTPRRAPYISNNTAKRGGRPVKTTKLRMSPLLIDYYRNRDGFQQDIELILAKTGIGPAALARVLGVSRGRIHAWRSQGLPDRMDPLAFLQVAWWVAILRGNKWPWQR